MRGNVRAGRVVSILGAAAPKNLPGQISAEMREARRSEHEQVQFLCLCHLDHTRAKDTAYDFCGRHGIVGSAAERDEKKFLGRTDRAARAAGR